jgi:hypothetical protein
MSMPEVRKCWKRLPPIAVWRLAPALPPSFVDAALRDGVCRLSAAAGGSGTVPALYWLSGLTCSDENFMQKAGAMRVAAELGIALVAPDTSPRGAGVPGDPEGAWDFGHGAGFYVNATQAPWASTTGCTTTWSTSCRNCSRRVCRSTPPRHQWPFDGRPRRAGLCAAQPWPLSLAVGAGADQPPARQPLGAEGLLRAIWAKTVRHGKPGTLRTDRRGGRTPALAGRPG